MCDTLTLPLNQLSHLIGSLINQFNKICGLYSLYICLDLLLKFIYPFPVYIGMCSHTHRYIPIKFKMIYIVVGLQVLFPIYCSVFSKI